MIPPVASTLLTIVLAQSATPAVPPTASKMATLAGCIERDRSAPGQYTFADSDGISRFRLSGKNLKKFVGKRVEIVGGPPGKRVAFRTGLWPSPNVAAQAGGMDPARAAVANLPGGAADGVGPMVLPEFHVVELRGIDGGCS